MTVFIQKGDKPMSYRQATKRGVAHLESQKLKFQREQGAITGDQEYLEWANQWINDNVINEQNNRFNHALYQYRKALARLAKYKKSEGREEITEQMPTGEFDDETGEEIEETIVVQTAIDPLPATIEQNVYDEQTGEITGTETVPNPEIVQDEQERAAAQAVIDNTPNEVKTFNEESQ